MQQPGSIESEELRAGLILTRMRGHVSAQVARAARAPFRACLLKGSRPTWIIDVTGITGFEASTVAVGAQWYEDFSGARGRRVLFVATHRGAKTAARTLGWGARMQVEHFESLEDALAALS